MPTPPGQDVSTTRQVPPVADKPTSPLNDPALDDQVEHPDEGRDAPPDILSADAIRQAIQSRATAADETLAALRKERDTFNAKVKKDRVVLAARIRKAADEATEAHRLAAALKPRTRKTKAKP